VGFIRAATLERADRLATAELKRVPFFRLIPPIQFSECPPGLSISGGILEASSVRSGPYALRLRDDCTVYLCDNILLHLLRVHGCYHGSIRDADHERHAVEENE